MKPVIPDYDWSIFGVRVAGVKSEVSNRDPEGVTQKTNATLIMDGIIFAINMKLVEVMVPPALCYLENEVKYRLRGISRSY